MRDVWDGMKKKKKTLQAATRRSQMFRGQWRGENQPIPRMLFLDQHHRATVSSKTTSTRIVNYLSDRTQCTKLTSNLTPCSAALESPSAPVMTERKSTWARWWTLLSDVMGSICNQTPQKPKNWSLTLESPDQIHRLRAWNVAGLSPVMIAEKRMRGKSTGHHVCCWHVKFLRGDSQKERSFSHCISDLTWLKSTHNTSQKKSRYLVRYSSSFSFSLKVNFFFSFGTFSFLIHFTCEWAC